MTKVMPNVELKLTKFNMRWIKYTLLSVLFIILMLLILLSNTHIQHFLLKELDKKFDNISISQIEGNLFEKIILSDLHFSNENFSLAITQLQLSISPQCLIKWKICVEQFSLSDSDVNIKFNDTSNIDNNNIDNKTYFSFPIGLTVKKIELDNSVISFDNNNLSISHLISGIDIQNNKIIVKPTVINKSEFIYSLTDNNKDDSPMTLESVLHFLGHPILSKDISFSIPLFINIDDLNINQFSVLNKNSTSKEKSQVAFFNKINLSGKLDNSLFHVNKLIIESDIVNVQSSLLLKLVDKYELNGNIYLDNLSQSYLKLPNEKLNISLSGELLGVTRLNINATGNINLKAGMNVQLSEAKTPLNIDITGDDFAYPIDNENKNFLRVKEFDFHLTGDTAGYFLTLNKAIDVDYLGNHINLTGNINSDMNLSIDISSSNLKSITSDIDGDFKAKITLTGEIKKPIIGLDFSSNHLNYQHIQLEHSLIKANLSFINLLSGGVEFQANQIIYLDHIFHNTKLKLSGNEANHQLSFNMMGKDLGIIFRLNGIFDRHNKIWSGKLADAKIKSPLGNWINNIPIEAKFNYLTSSAEIHSHCWSNSQTQLCFLPNIKLGKENNVIFEMRKFNLSSLEKYLPENTKLSGIVDIKGSFISLLEKPFELKTILNSKNIKFTQKLNSKWLTLETTQLENTLNILDKKLSNKINLTMSDGANLLGDIIIDDLLDKQLLSGQLELSKVNLSMFSQLLNKEDKCSGDFAGNIKLSGTLSSPSLKGNLALNHLMINSYFLPFHINDGYINLQLEGHEAYLNGKIINGENSLDLNGKGYWKSFDQWNIYLKTKGDRFPLNIPNIAQLRINPDIELSASEKSLEITGNINIPWARIEVSSIDDDIANTSRDEIILNSSQDIEKYVSHKSLVEGNQLFMIGSNVTINIGDDVKLQAYGIKTALKGNLIARQSHQGLALYGQIHLMNGSYTSFGQDLIIRKGVISFTGSPSQPGLSIEAIRNPEAMENSNITAGIKISGIADSLSVNVFSEPAMSQAQALSYVLTGNSLENSNDTGAGNSLSAALISMSISRSNRLVGTVGEVLGIFGIKDFSISTSGIGDNIQIVMSGSLNNRFKIKYGIGVFSPLAELTLRYRLTQSLYLQWVSSINQAVDLLYRFQFD